VRTGLVERSSRDDGSNDCAAQNLRLVEADATHTEGDHPGWQIPQNWYAEKKPELPGTVRLLSPQRTADQILLHEGLHGLDGARWPFRWRCTSARSAPETLPANSGFVRTFAATAASWMA